MAKKHDDGGPVLPRIAYVAKADSEGDRLVVYEADGIRLRDLFAGLAMQGLLANIETCRVLANDIQVTGRMFNEEVAAVAYEQADAMLARSKGGAS